MVDERTSVTIDGFMWTERTFAHIAGHDVTPADIMFVRLHAPLTFKTSPGDFRFATHALVGQDGRGRSLIVFISETTEPGIWNVHTAYQARLAHNLLEREGRL